MLTATRTATIRHPAVLVASITAVALALRLWGLDDKSLWIDEAFTEWVATQPLEAVWRYTTQLDQHPPLYYALLHLWLGGDGSPGEGALRGFSVLWGVATVPVVFLIGRDVATAGPTTSAGLMTSAGRAAGGSTTGARLGLLAATLQAVSPLHVWYGQQARMYAMLTFFAVLATACLVRLLSGNATTPAGRAGCWTGLAVATALTMLSHNTGVLFTAAIVVFLGALVLRNRRRDPDATIVISGWDRRVAPLAWATAAGLVLWLPWLPGFLLQSGRVDEEFWLPPPTVDTVLEHLRNLGSANAPGPAVVLVALFGGIAALGCVGLRRRPEMLLLLLALLLVPLVGELVVSLRRPIFYSQTLLWTSVPLTVLLAAGLLHLRRIPLVVAATGALMLLHTAALTGYYRKAGAEDWRGAARYVAASARPGDVVLFDAGWTQLAFDFYYDGPRIEEHGLPADPFDRGVLEPRLTAVDLPRIDALVEGRTRVWVVYSHDWYTDPEQLVTAHLDATTTTVERRELASIRIVTHSPR